MKKLLTISGHFSTGGSGQYTYIKCKLIKDNFEIKVIEQACVAWSFVVQRNRMIELMFICNCHYGA